MALWRRGAWLSAVSSSFGRLDLLASATATDASSCGTSRPARSRPPSLTNIKAGPGPDSFACVTKDLQDQSQRPIHAAVLRDTPNGDDKTQTLELVLGPGKMGITIILENGRLHITKVNRDGPEELASILQEGS